MGGCHHYPSACWRLYKSFDPVEAMSRARLASIAARDVRGVRRITPRVHEVRTRRIAFRILENNVLCSMATVIEDNRAHINTAYFCYSDELEVYFLSHPGSLHCRNLSKNPSMGIAIFSWSQRWAGPDRGLQLIGACPQARGQQATRAERLYAKRFRSYARWRSSLKRTDAAREYRFYRFVCGRLKILDEAEFGDAVFVSATVRRARTSGRSR